MTLEQWRFQNPLEILLANEARSCKGCTHSAVVFDRQYCGKGKKHGRRCGAYQEKQNHQGEEMLRRVRKEEVKGGSFHKPDPLTECLNIWVKWSIPDDFALQHRERTSDNDEKDQPYVIADLRVGEAVNTMVFDLPRHYRWAIQKRCGVTTSGWNYPHLVYENVLAEAEALLTEKMKKSFATANYFR